MPSLFQELEIQFGQLSFLTEQRRVLFNTEKTATYQDQEQDQETLI